ncbi:hypothetical protein [Bacillus velezensis]|uniref:hypothetical protein n=1 Tax=Bacillus velezensis TaxID=492670 RepID=UPI00146B638D|nr:hypothetical protein [Bacillus velezensis]NMV98054.1 hypothetical protein [Bacillus velezensis]
MREGIGITSFDMHLKYMYYVDLLRNAENGHIRISKSEYEAIYKKSIELKNIMQKVFVKCDSSNRDVFSISNEIKTLELSSGWYKKMSEEENRMKKCVNKDSMILDGQFNLISYERYIEMNTYYSGILGKQIERLEYLYDALKS